jgi:hypothetical protein
MRMHLAEGAAMTDLIDWFHASQNVGRALFGADYIENLTYRERFLLEEYDLLGQDDDERAIAKVIGKATPGATSPADRPDYALVIWAQQRLRFMRWQDRIVDNWIQDHGLECLVSDENLIQLDRQKFSAAFAKDFPDRTLEEGGKPNLAAAFGRLGIGGRKRKWDWDAMHRFVISLVADDADGLPVEPSKLTELCETWFVQTYGNQPDNSKVREKVKAIYDAHEQERAKRAKAKDRRPPLKVTAQRRD